MSLCTQNKVGTYAFTLKPTFMLVLVKGAGGKGGRVVTICILHACSLADTNYQMFKYTNYNTICKQKYISLIYKLFLLLLSGIS